MFDALNFCREWSQYRSWIKSNEYSLTDFDQEIKFQRIVKHYDLNNLSTRIIITQRLNQQLDALVKQRVTKTVVKSLMEKN